VIDTTKLFVISAVTGVFTTAAIWALCSNMQYTVDSCFVRVLFFGCTIRKIAISDVEYADKKWKWWNEHYHNTLNPRKIIRLRRRTGGFRNFIITPPDPDLFLSELAAQGISLR